ncbi:transcriptional regulator GcvA [Flexibacterium corallicola]|uniref:transcriptional regulator GcvA n=1 Tax=Flexibacterium corallicola TaxID=3037259 RepID=UPI00286EEBAA|nr:transcriptional regulator GcvA [Pseudovibrio sp. M1P-2-3]
MSTLKYPPLANLQAFIAVGKMKSFTKAAEELLLTPGAVSQKIKNLEDQLGHKLLIRNSRRVTFTAKGETYFNEVYPAVMTITNATHNIFSPKQKSVLTLSITPSFALHWLVPRLEGFYRDHPGITINIHASNDLVDFEIDDIDLAIRHGLGTYPKLKVERLFCEDLIPVCSPSLINGPFPLTCPEDLAGHTLLHNAAAKDWELLVRAIDIDLPNAGNGPRFNYDALKIQSAIEGHGVALARASLVQRELTQGSLTIPFKMRFPIDFAHYAVYPRSRSIPQELYVFLEWLKAEAAHYSVSQEETAQE